MGIGKAITKEKRARIIELLKTDLTIDAIAIRTELSRQSVSRINREETIRFNRHKAVNPKQVLD
ncbi:MAG: hypothetical protein WAX85_00345 [Minisyncoccia bacterium]